MREPEQLAPGIFLYEADAKDVLAQLRDGEVSATVTDPPYGIGYAGSQSVGGTVGRKKAYWREWNTNWDEQLVPSELMLQVIGIAPKSIVWGGNYYSHILPASGGWLVWDKTQRDLSFGDGELAWTNTANSLRIFSLNRCHVTRDGKQHPSQKPVALMRWCIQQLPDDAGTILDPFAGSGTTAVAAMLEGRKCILIEKDPAYCEVIRRRVRECDQTAPGTLFANVPTLFATLAEADA